MLVGIRFYYDFSIRHGYGEPGAGGKYISVRLFAETLLPDHSPS